MSEINDIRLKAKDYQIKGALAKRNNKLITNLEQNVTAQTDTGVAYAAALWPAGAAILLYGGRRQRHKPCGDRSINGGYAYNTVLLRGGTANGGSTAGALSGSWDSTASSSSWYYSARPVLKTPQGG